MLIFRMLIIVVSAAVVGFLVDSGVGALGHEYASHAFGAAAMLFTVLNSLPLLRIITLLEEAAEARTALAV